MHSYKSSKVVIDGPDGNTYHVIALVHGDCGGLHDVFHLGSSVATDEPLWSWVLADGNVCICDAVEST